MQNSWQPEFSKVWKFEHKIKVIQCFTADKFLQNIQTSCTFQFYRENKCKNRKNMGTLQKFIVLFTIKRKILNQLISVESSKNLQQQHQ